MKKGFHGMISPPISLKGREVVFKAFFKKLSKLREKTALRSHRGDDRKLIRITYKNVGPVLMIKHGIIGWHGSNIVICGGPLKI